MEEQRNDSHSGSVSDSLGVNKVFVFNCPYLGTLEDADTSLAYPAVANHCFRVDSPTAVDLSHQESYCLSDQHPSCHVFQLADAALVESEPVVEQTAPPKTSKRRLSLLTLPIILILILLAAIIWWPAPGTTIQESLVRGAQNDREVSGDATLTGKPVSEPSETESSTAITVPETIAEPADGTLLNDDSAEQDKATETVPSPKAADSNNAAGSVEVESALRPDTTVGSNQPAEAAQPSAPNVITIASAQSTDEQTIETEVAAEDTAVIDGKQAASPDVFEDSADSTAPDEAPITVFQDTASEDVEEDTVSADEEEEVDETETIVTTDLPVVSADTSAAVTAPAATESTSDAGQTVVMVGPVASTALSLGDVSEDFSILPIYQGAAGDGALLSQIDSRQFVTLLGRDSSGEWLNIRLENGVEGWINAHQSGADLETAVLPAVSEQSIPAATSFPVIRYAYVDTGALNLRSGPGVSYDAFSILSKGEIVGLIGRRALGPWVRIRLEDGTEGWVNSSLLAPVS